MPESDLHHKMTKMKLVKFRFVTNGQSEEKEIELAYMSSWETIISQITEHFLDVESSCTMSLVNGEDQYFGNDISDAFTFWKMYETAYSPEDDCIFAIVNDVLIKVRFFLSFNLDAHAVVDFPANCSWKAVKKIIASKFSQLSEDIDHVSVMNSTDAEEIASDGKSFWDLVWIHDHDSGITNMMVHGGRAYEVLCQLEVSPVVVEKVKIPQSLAWMDAVKLIKTSLHLMSAQKVTKIEVVDCDGESIGQPCGSVEDLWRKFSRSVEVDPQTKVLVHSSSENSPEDMQLSDWTFDGRAADIHGHKFDFRGKHCTFTNHVCLFSRIC